LSLAWSKTATKAVSWNGGSKIVPSRGCVSNPWPANKDFVVGSAEWNNLSWSKEELVCYVKNSLPKQSLKDWTGDDIIEEGMTPRNAAATFVMSVTKGVQLQNK
jgi:hypothetical protein